jgi:hypothetical protein
MSDHPHTGQGMPGLDYDLSDPRNHLSDSFSEIELEQTNA